MSYHDTVVREINATLDALAEARKKWIPNWVAHDLCKRHGDALPESEGAEWWRYTSYQYVRDLVRKQINARAGDQVSNPQQHQLVLNGFDRRYLQDYYMIEHRDEAVPVTEASDGELHSKAAQYRAMGKTCFAHADEIEHFIVWRRQANTA